jgi:hypothetical protein
MHVVALESHVHYFPKGYYQAPSTETIPVPHVNEAVVFEDMFVVGICMLPHLVLVEILQKFKVQLHQLTPNVIVHIGKFIWAVSSYGGHPIADVFARHYELHYKKKKIKLKGSDNTLSTQFGCITSDPSCYGGRAKLTPYYEEQVVEWLGQELVLLSSAYAEDRGSGERCLSPVLGDECLGLLDGSSPQLPCRRCQ